MNSNDDAKASLDPLLMVASSGSMSNEEELVVSSMPDPADFLRSSYDDDDDDEDEDQNNNQGVTGRSMVMEPTQSSPRAQSPYGEARKPTQQNIEEVVGLSVQNATEVVGGAQKETIATPAPDEPAKTFAAEPQRKNVKPVKEKRSIPPFVRYILIVLVGIIVAIGILAGLGYMMQSNRAPEQIDLSSIGEEVELSAEIKPSNEVVLPAPSKPVEKVVTQEAVVSEPTKSEPVEMKATSDSALNARVEQVTSQLNNAVIKISGLEERVNTLSNENVELKAINSSLKNDNLKLESENELLSKKKPAVNEGKSAPLPVAESKGTVTTNKAEKVSRKPTVKAQNTVKPHTYKRPVVSNNAVASKPQQFTSVRRDPNSQVAPFVNAGSVVSKPAYEVISVMNGKVTLKDPSKAADSQVYSSGSLVPGYGAIAKISDNGCVQFTDGQNLCRR
jgi:regulator of replication initiation timing